MTDVSTILGIALVGVGAASAVYGGILCYTTKVCTKFWVLEFLLGWYKSKYKLVWFFAKCQNIVVSKINFLHCLNWKNAQKRLLNKLVW